MEPLLVLKGAINLFLLFFVANTEHFTMETWQFVLQVFVSDLNLTGKFLLLDEILLNVPHLALPGLLLLSEFDVLIGQGRKLILELAEFRVKLVQLRIMGSTEVG